MKFIYLCGPNYYWRPIEVQSGQDSNWPTYRLTTSSLVGSAQQSRQVRGFRQLPATKTGMTYDFWGKYDMLKAVAV